MDDRLEVLQLLFVPICAVLTLMAMVLVLILFVQVKQLREVMGRPARQQMDYQIIQQPEVTKAERSVSN